ncbi:Conserved Oligomeric Golgi Complex Subunit 2, partial [Manis pentadactyla]
EDFDVDHLVSGGRKHVQLEELRDDLELDDELLKTAMVGLINKDYADFVNLSTNLVGMDKALNQLPAPLGQLREEVLFQNAATEATSPPDVGIHSAAFKCVVIQQTCAGSSGLAVGLQLGTEKRLSSALTLMEYRV